MKRLTNLCVRLNFQFDKPHAKTQMTKLGTSTTEYDCHWSIENLLTGRDLKR